MSVQDREREKSLRESKAAVLSEMASQDASGVVHHGNSFHMGQEEKAADPSWPDVP